MRKTYPGRDAEIVRLYASREFMTEHIARTFHITPRRVQQIAKKHGVLRSHADGNRTATPLKVKRRISRSKVRITLPS